MRYRAWNHDTNKMEYGCYPTIALFPFMGMIIVIEGRRNRKGTWDFHIVRCFNGKEMKSTGFKDKDRKEIYEGDIIENNNGIYLEIYWNEDLGQWRQQVCNKENVLQKGYEWQEKPTDLGLMYNFKKVIGNKYENPELLNKE